MILRPTASSASRPFSAVPFSYAPTTRSLKSSISTTFRRMSSASSSTGTSNSFIVTPCRSILCVDCGAFAGVCQHHVTGNFHQLAVTARNGFQVVLHHPFTAFAEILSECFFDTLEQIFIADAAVGRERRDAQEYAQEHDTLHALLQVRERRDFFCDLDGVQRENSRILLDQFPSSPSRNGAPDFGGLRFRTLDEHHAVLREAGKGVLEIESVDVIEGDEFDVLQF